MIGQFPSFRGLDRQPDPGVSFGQHLVGLGGGPLGIGASEYYRRFRYRNFMCEVTRSTTLALIGWDSVVIYPDFDKVQFASHPGLMWNPAYPKRLTIPIDGLYEIGGHAYFVVGQGSYPMFHIRKNGTKYIMHELAWNNFTKSLNGRVVENFKCGEYVEFGVYVGNTNDTMQIEGAEGTDPTFYIERLSDSYVN